MKSSSCPICQSGALPFFSTQYAEVHRCSNPECCHRFAEDLSRLSGVVEYRTQTFQKRYIDRNHRLIDYLLDFRCISEGMSVLDLGSGEGHIAQCFHDRGFEVLCVEPSENARIMLEDRGLPNYADVSKIPKKKLLDFMYSVEVVEHLPKPVETLRLAGRRLRPGAYFLVTTPSGEALKARVAPARSEAFSNPTHLHFFTPRSLKQCISKAGFTYIDQRSLDFMVPDRAVWRTMASKFLRAIGLGSGIIMFGRAPLSD